MFRTEDLVEGVLILLRPKHKARGSELTMDMITTQGKFRDEMIALAREVFPLPDEPATPIMLVFAHGGE